MSTIKDLAEPLHWHVASHNLAAHDVECFNAGVDTVVDAVEQQGLTLIPVALLQALVRDLNDLERALQEYRAGNDLVFPSAPFLQEHWPAARELITLEAS